MFLRNRNVRIGGAAVLGILVILVALYFRNTGNQDVSSGITVVENTPVERPSQRDLEDTWEQVLQDRTQVTKITADPSIEVGDTYTDTFARSFFESYIRNSSSGTLTDANTEQFLNTSLASLSDKVENDYFTKEDITVGPGTSVYLRAYGNTIAGIIRAHQPEGEEEILQFFETALESKNAADFEKLQVFVDSYDSALQQILAVSVPPTLIEEHLGFLNSTLAIRNDIEGMRLGHEDPLYAAVRVGRYQTDLESLYAALTDIYLYIYRQGIRYTEDEPGSMFKLN